MLKKHLTIASRKSPLAMKQTEQIRDALLHHYPHLTINILGISTEGDKRLDVMLSEIGGKGLFVKELEEALLDGRADLAVHSMKDMPMDLPKGLAVPVMSQREEPYDVFVSNRYDSFSALPAGAIVGTSSLRRQTQLYRNRADLKYQSLRGNIQTRLQRLDEGHYDAIILAAAGLIRLGQKERIKEILSPDLCLPSAGQGVLGLECRKDDAALIDLISPINDARTMASVLAERALCRRLGGGCKVPLAAFAILEGDTIYLRAAYAMKDGVILKTEVRGEMQQAEQLGLEAAQLLIAQGAQE